MRSVEISQHTLKEKISRTCSVLIYFRVRFTLKLQLNYYMETQTGQCNKIKPPKEKSQKKWIDTIIINNKENSTISTIVLLVLSIR